MSRIWELVGGVLRPGTALAITRVQLNAGGATAATKVGAAVAVSTTITNTTVETAFSNAPAGAVLAANTLLVGDKVRIRVAGKAPVTNSTDTLTVKIKIGTTVLIATAAVDVANNDRFIAEFEFTVRTIGASGTIVGSGEWVLGVPGTATKRMDGLDSTAIDTTVANTITATATWSVASASNQVYCDEYDVYKA